MEKFLEKLDKAAKSVVLRADRKQMIRTQLINYIEQNPVAVRPSFSGSVFYRHFILPSAAFAGLMLLVGSGTSIAAEKALPGDPLYGIKINFTEPLIGALNTSTEGRAAWEARVAERRLEEADKLAISGKLDAESKAQIAQNFSRFADKAQKKISLLNETGKEEAAGEISARFESSLAAHSKILAALNLNSSAGVLDTSSELNDKVAIALNKASVERGEAEARVESKDDKLVKAAKGKIGAASNVIASTRSMLQKMSSLSPESKLAVEERLRNAEGFLKDARAELEAKRYAESFRLANQALRYSQETRVLASAQAVADKNAAEESDDKNTVAALRFNFLDDSSAAGAATMSIAAKEASTSTATSTATSTSTSTATSSEITPNSSMHVEATELEIDIR